MPNKSDHTNIFTVLRWTVRIVFTGDKYGKDNCLTSDASEPFVEFYDNHQNKAVFGELGQFVTRYSLSTLIESTRHGLCLDGGIPEWSVSADEFSLIQKQLVKLTQG